MKNKKNVIITCLCIVIIVMVFGYYKLNSVKLIEVVASKTEEKNNILP